MLTLGASGTLPRRVLQQPSAPLGTTARCRQRRPLLPPAAGGSGEGKWGNANRLGPVGGEGSGEQWLPELDTTLLHSIDSGDGSAAAPPAAEWQQALAEKAGQLQYQYFNWRQDTRSDLQLFIFLNTLVYLFGALVQNSIIRQVDSSVEAPPEGAGPLSTLWYSLYKVLSVVLGQDLPEEQAGWPSQLFAVITAVFGLASFALVLALIEQVVLEVLERNVKRGSLCYEQGHTAVLAWCESSRDVAQLTRILTQLCAANRVAGGGVVVVLTQQRGKLEMEQLFREVVPEQNRYGTQFVFRQGSPLDPAALRLVAAQDARAIIVSGDYSKTAQDADAQVLRTCVLLDELIEAEGPEGSSGPIVVAQVKTEDALSLMRYACSQRVVAVPTNKVNARRYVRLLRHPIAAVFSRCMSDFYSPAHGHIDPLGPEELGRPFAELHFRFPDALVMGLYNPESGQCRLNPPPDQLVQPGDELVVMRPERLRGSPHKPLHLDKLPPEVAAAASAAVDLGAWDPAKYALKSQDEQPLADQFPAQDPCLSISARAHTPARETAPQAWRRRRACGARSPSRRGPVEAFQTTARGLFMLPNQYSSKHDGEEGAAAASDELLICGWMGNTFMWELLAELDHSDQALPAGSRVTLFNDHPWTPDQLEERCRQHDINSLDVRHVVGDPRSRAHMKRLVDVTKFKAAFVVCDSSWAGSVAPNADGGLQLLSHSDMLGLDAAVLTIQLNLRQLLEEAAHPAINIICEKLTYVGTTRFEDDSRLPLGIAVNSASYAAKALTQVAVSPRYMAAYLQIGKESDLHVQDASAFASLGEKLSFLQLQARAASVRQVLMGWYRIPVDPSTPLEMVVNPQGLAERSKARVWNAGDLRCKLVTMALTKKAAAAAVAEAVAAAGEAEAQASDNGIGIYGSGEFAAVASSRQEASADSVDNS